MVEPNKLQVGDRVQVLGDSGRVEDLATVVEVGPVDVKAVMTDGSTSGDCVVQMECKVKVDSTGKIVSQRSSDLRRCS
jgi:hypothetical protein